MKPTQILCQRLKSRVRFTTKDVGKGFYRGSGVGSLGAHTKHGHYLIDYRKVRHFVVPNLANCQLTPFATGANYSRERLPVDLEGNSYDEKNIDGYQYLKWWKYQGSEEHYLAVEEEKKALQQQAQGQTAASTETSLSEQAQREAEARTA